MPLAIPLLAHWKAVRSCFQYNTPPRFGNRMERSHSRCTCTPSSTSPQPRPQPLEYTWGQRWLHHSHDRTTFPMLTTSQCDAPAYRPCYQRFGKRKRKIPSANATTVDPCRANKDHSTVYTQERQPMQQGPVKLPYWAQAISEWRCPHRIGQVVIKRICILGTSLRRCTGTYAMSFAVLLKGASYESR